MGNMLAEHVVWAIERNLDRPLTLAELADACGVSRFHLAHAFGRATGLSVMHYVRARRLSEAARSLATGNAPDILSLALDTGYGSHEAFSRAFRAQFGTTPEAVRKSGHVEDLAMTKAMKLPQDANVVLAPPRFVSGDAMLVVGLVERHSFGATEGIPGQWQRFMQHYAEIADKLQPIPLGISANMDDDGNFEYMTAVQVSDASDLPNGMQQWRIPAQHYAVFRHDAHVAAIGQTYSAIFNEWLPAHGRRAADGPIIERHREGFDPWTGLGGVDIWIPLEAAGR